MQVMTACGILSDIVPIAEISSKSSFKSSCSKIVKILWNSAVSPSLPGGLLFSKVEMACLISLVLNGYSATFRLVSLFYYEWY